MFWSNNFKRQIHPFVATFLIQIFSLTFTSLSLTFTSLSLTFTSLSLIFTSLSLTFTSYPLLSYSPLSPPYTHSLSSFQKLELIRLSSRAQLSNAIQQISGEYKVPTLKVAKPLGPGYLMMTLHVTMTHRYTS